MGYVKRFVMDNEGAGWENLDNLDFADAVELELAVTQNAVQIACVICFQVIPAGSGNTCDTHKGMKPQW